MTGDEWRQLLDERFGTLREVEREGRRMSYRAELARRRRRLAEAMRDTQ